MATAPTLPHVRRPLAGLLLLGLLLIGSGACADSWTTPHTLEVAGATRTYYLHVPRTAADAMDPPLLVLLHPTGGDGRYMLREWMPTAEREGIVLLAPNATTPAGWRLREDGPQYLRQVIEAIATTTRFNPRRMYLFGYSAGAIHTLTVGMLESEYFAAIALYAGAWRDRESLATTRLADRRIPVAMFVGDHDEEFSMDSVTATRSALVRAGHRVQLTILPGQGHVYPGASSGVDREAWAFLKAVELPEAPRFKAYQ